MNKCIFCRKTKEKNRPLYCSTVCVKKAWCFRNKPNSKVKGRDKDFWLTATGLGFKWEKRVAKLLNAKHLPFNNGADLDWNGKSVDVKSAHLDFRKNKRGLPVKTTQKGYWVFNTSNKTRPDFFFFVALLKNKVYKMLLIPGSEILGKGITLGWQSKYDKFIFK